MDTSATPLSFAQRLKQAKAALRPARRVQKKPVKVASPKNPKPKTPTPAKPEKQKVKEVLMARQAKKDQLAFSESRKRFETKNIDLSTRIPLKFDRNTTIYIRPDQDPAEVIAKYKNRSGLNISTI